MEKSCLFFAFVLSSLYFMASSDITVDQSTLLAFKSYITLDPQDMLANNWTSASSVCNWFGVTCDNGRVTGLTLTNLSLNGTLSPFLGNLSFLVNLDLHNNSFHGIVPKELALLPRLEVFNLCTNKLGGEFPTWIGELPKLQHLSLCNNTFSGSIPASLSNLLELETLDLTFNFLYGSIPTQLGRLHNLTVLELAHNQLSSDIPSSIFNISKLQVINLAYNSLSGSIPQKVGELPQLRSINLSKNKLSGPIPSSLFNISTLQEIQIIYNNLSGSLPSDMCHGFPMLEILDLSGNAFSGQIPPSLHQCKGLKYLKMINNRFYGPLPSEIGRLSMQEQLDLSLNNLTGSLPSSLFNISSLRLINLRNNNFGGRLPKGMCQGAHSLQQISILNNKVGGTIPSSIGNCTSLTSLFLGANFFTGTIPYEIGHHLKKLGQLHLQGDQLRGSIPSNIFNISGLNSLSLSNNQFSGNLPIYPYHSLSNLQFLYLTQCNLSGEIPNSLYNASSLRQLVLAENSFTGFISDSIGKLRNLQLLYLIGNMLTSDPKSPEIGFLTSLTNCRQLKQILLSFNPLNGTLPNSIGNFSNSLETFKAWSCNIKGKIPSQIGNLKSLFDINLSENQLTGQIPSAVGTLKLLQRLDLSDNKLNGSIPGQICQLKNLNELRLSKNHIFGTMPGCIGHLTSLRILYLNSNRLNSSIPSSLWSLTDILEVNLSSNNFTGPLPNDIGSMNALINLDISKNQLSGNIPNGIGGLQAIMNLSLAYNMLQGPIPDSVGNMLSLELLDLSHNLLSGIIPKSMEKLLYLKFINFSYNRLQGEIPSGGNFKYFNAQSFMMNDALCGRLELKVQPCSNNSATKHKKTGKRLVLRLTIPITVFGILLSYASLLIIYWRKRDKGSTGVDLPNLQFPSRISYYELVEATQKFDESNLLGRGRFGMVYKGKLSNGELIAVKVFNLDVQGALRSFDAECVAMRNLRHRNLVKVITSCSNALDFKALVMEFMPNGSLEKWLFSHNYFLPFIKRLDIAIDVASALEYLHHGNSKPVVHCDVKPSNVVLDENMIAHVCDFSIAKLLEEEQSQMHTNTMATLGYIAPEYGSEGVVSIKGDVYSFGIMLMEVFTRKKPTDEMYVEKNLRSWIQESMPHQIIQVMDPNLLEGEEQLISVKEAALLNIMELALNCSADSPDDRMSMKDILSCLNKIKTTFLRMEKRYLV